MQEIQKLHDLVQANKEMTWFFFSDKTDNLEKRTKELDNKMDHKFKGLYSWHFDHDKKIVNLQEELKELKAQLNELKKSRHSPDNTNALENLRV